MATGYSESHSQYDLHKQFDALTHEIDHFLCSPMPENKPPVSKLFQTSLPPKHSDVKHAPQQARSAVKTKPLDLSFPPGKFSQNVAFGNPVPETSATVRVDTTLLPETFSGERMGEWEDWIKSFRLHAELNGWSVAYRVVTSGGSRSRAG